MTFRGIPVEGLEFYDRLEADNTKPFWQANKASFADDVRAPIEALCAELDDYGPFHLFRPHNDLRFHKNRPPYKTHQGVFTESEGGAGYYFQVSAEGLMCASGYYFMAKDQLARFRAAVDADHTGAAIETIVAGLARRYEISAIDELKTAPRGFPKDHPRIELLRRKGLMAVKHFGTPKWLHTRQVITKIRTMWEDLAEMNAWLDTHVGPSELDSEGWFR